MKQLLQNLKTGDTKITDIPTPQVKPGCLLIQSQRSVISAGTERMLVEFSNANLIDKARQQPEKVKMVLEKIQTDGLFATIDAVNSKLDQAIPLGYSNAGIVIEVGEGTSGFCVGDRVISNGCHSEIVCVPKNLCSTIPDSVDFESAAFSVIGSIALQGIRLLQPTLGESIVVTGLGLVGLLTVQLLVAHGCRVLGIDFDETKLELARNFGAETVNLTAGEDPIAAAQQFSRGRGIDGVILSAATKSNEPVKQAATMARKHGRIILVGVAGLELSRNDFYEKELTFQVSCSYGPGRYDPTYEELGIDYPAGHVRWTENRNFEAVLDMLDHGKLDLTPLVTHRFPFSQAKDAYSILTSKEKSLGIVLEYPDVPISDWKHNQRISIQIDSSFSHTSKKPCVGILGAGNYATRTLLPILHKQKTYIKSIASQGGVRGVHAAQKFKIQEAVTDATQIITDPEIDTLFILTQHQSHARFVIDALNHGKHVFVEKPLAITQTEIDEIKTLYSSLEKPPVLMVGFNRRFAPHSKRIKTLLDSTSAPKSFVMSVNAGKIPIEHWTQDPKRGGGRIIGEACHFIDLLRFFAGCKILSANACYLGNTQTRDTVSIQLQFEDGSIGTIHYFANGNQAFPKERLEVFCDGKILQLDNFRTLRGYGWSNFKTTKLWKQDKGHSDEMTAFLEAITIGDKFPISFNEMIEISQISIELSNNASQIHT